MAQKPTEDLCALARKAALAAYSPYSKFRVGAAAAFESSPRIHTGCNIENASYGLTMCAERVAVFNGVAFGHKKLARIAIAVLDENNEPVQCFKPCGACLQVMAEFATPDTKILLDGIGTFLLSNFLPSPFTLV
jgi:cytidine deaminase